MFNLHNPCGDCPFLRGSQFAQSLDQDRKTEIVNSILSDRVFKCHKTTTKTADDEGETPIYDARHQSCAGSMLIMHRNLAYNLPMRLGILYGLLDVDALDDSGRPVYNTFEEWLEEG